MEALSALPSSSGWQPLSEQRRRHTGSGTVHHCLSADTHCTSCTDSLDLFPALQNTLIVEGLQPTYHGASELATAGTHTLRHKVKTRHAVFRGRAAVTQRLRACAACPLLPEGAVDLCKEQPRAVVLRK